MLRKEGKTMDITIRRANDGDIPALDRLLFEVHKVHSDVRPDLFKSGAKKYTDAELRDILKDEKTPVFVVETADGIAGYAFCIAQQHVGSRSMTDVRTLYIDDLCVDERVRGLHIGKRLYEYVLAFAKEQGFYNVTLNVWADNVKAVGFYEKLGLRVQKIGMEKIL